MPQYYPSFFQPIRSATALDDAVLREKDKGGEEGSSVAIGSITERMLEEYKYPHRFQQASFLQRRAYQCLINDEQLTLNDLLCKIKEFAHGNPALEKVLAEKVMEILRLKAGMSNQGGKLLELAESLRQHYNDQNKNENVATSKLGNTPRLTKR